MKKQLSSIIIVCVILVIIGTVAFAAGKPYSGISASITKDGATYAIENLRQEEQLRGTYKLSLDVTFKDVYSLEFASSIVLAQDESFQKPLEISSRSIANGTMSITAIANEKISTLYIQMPTPVKVGDEEVLIERVLPTSVEYEHGEQDKESVTYMTLVFDSKKFPITPRYINVVSDMLDGKIIECIAATSYMDPALDSLSCEFTYVVPEGYSFEEDTEAELLLVGSLTPLEPAVIAIVMK